MVRILLEKVKGCVCMLMDNFMKDFGKITNEKEEEEYLWLMEMFMMECGEMTFLMGLEFIHGNQGGLIKENL